VFSLDSKIFISHPTPGHDLNQRFKTKFVAYVALVGTLVAKLYGMAPF